MDKKLHITLLGIFKITYQGNVISDVNTIRLQELLSWLLLHKGEFQSRQRLSFTFWPESRESQARTNLRNLLHLLRKALPDFDSFIMVEHTSLKWNQDSDFTCDVDNFEKAIAAARLVKDPRERELNLREGVLLYKGHLLPDSYSEWIEQHRDRLKLDYQYALKELVKLSKINRNYDKGIQYAKMWTSEEPFNESAWRQLITLYALCNDRANALQTYKKCTDILRKELHIEPAPETLDLYEQLINNYREFKEPDQSLPSSSSENEWPLIARDKEWRTLQDNWKSTLSGQVRLMLIAGIAGIGKTRLATEFAGKIQRQGYPVIYKRCHPATIALGFGNLISCIKQKTLYSNINRLDDIWKAHLTRFLPELLVEYPDLEPPQNMGKPEERCKLFEAISKLFLAVDKPFLLLIEDLQWCDAETLDWISYHLQQSESANLFFLCTLNNEEITSGSTIEQFTGAHQSESYLKQLKLTPLDLQHTTELISTITGQAADKSTVQDIYNKCEGIPGKIVDALKQDIQGTGQQESTVIPILQKSTPAKHVSSSLSVDDSQQETEKINPGNTKYQAHDTRQLTGIHHLFTVFKVSLKYPYIISGLFLTIFLLQFVELPFFAVENHVTKKHTIGVLPFSNFSGENADEALTLSMVDILSNNLAQSNDFKVISHKSISFYNNEYSQTQMVRELDLDFLIEGSVQTSGDQARINIQLMDAKTSEYIWTKTYERYLGDIFFLQKKLAEDILAEVNAVLGHDAGPELAISTERVKPDALKYFMQAMNTESEKKWDEKLILLKQSIAIDSTFSPSYTHLAIAYAFRFAFTQADNYRQKSQQAIDRALAINPNSSLVYLAIAMLSEFNFKWENAEKAFQKTIEFNPLNEIAHHELAQHLMRLGRFEEAIESEKRAIYLAPNSVEYQNGLGEIYLFQRDYEKAILEMNKALQLNSDYYPSHRWLAKAYMHKQDYQKALDHYDIYAKLSNRFYDPSNFPGGLAQIYGYMGQKQKALDLIDTYLENNPVDTINTFFMLQLALAYTSINDLENALTWIERGQKSNAGWFIYMKIQPGFDPLRSNPRYQAAERRIFGKYSM